MTGWEDHLERELRVHAERVARLDDPSDEDPRQRRLTRIGNAAWGAGLCLIALGRSAEAAGWLARAAARYRESFAGAPPGSWGRPIGAIKARLLANDLEAARADAGWTLAAGSAEAESPIGRYAACLALLVQGRDGEALALARSLEGRGDFPGEVADALAALAAGDAAAYAEAALAVLRSFETREAYLEDVPLADTVLVLQSLAAPRGLAAALPASALLPPA